jgi:predicted ATPase
MWIKRLSASNFKSFTSLEIDLSGFTVIIGANAAGKSNIISIFRMLHDIAVFGLEDAVSLQGGAEYLRNITRNHADTLAITVQLDAIRDPVRLLLPGHDGTETAFACDELSYSLELSFEKSGDGFSAIKEELAGRFSSDDLPGSIIVMREGQAVVCRVEPQELATGLRLSGAGQTLEARRSLLEFTAAIPVLSPLVWRCSEFFSQVGVFDFDPKLLKKAAVITGRTRLDPDGSNLAVVLKTMLSDPEARKRILRLLSELAPFVEDITVQKIAETTIFSAIQERYSRDVLIPAPLMSDGTINITALVLALYYDDRPLVIFEEPGRNLHPYLISKLTDMMHEAPRHLGKQIIVTTHNPEFVKYAGMDHLLLIERDTSGGSNVRKPSEKQELAVFLEHLGIEELYIQNLL